MAATETDNRKSIKVTQKQPKIADIISKKNKSHKKPQKNIFLPVFNPLIIQNFRFVSAEYAKSRTTKFGSFLFASDGRISKQSHEEIPVACVWSYAKHTFLWKFNLFIYLPSEQVEYGLR